MRKQSVYDLPKLAELFERVKKYDPSACIEHVNAMPGQGVTSMFYFGYGLGLLHGMLWSKKIPFTIVTPRVWKKHFLSGMPSDKKSSVIHLERVFGDTYSRLTSKYGKNHNVADAYFLARYILEIHNVNRSIETGNETLRLDQGLSATEQEAV